MEVGCGWKCKWGMKDELTPLVFGKTLLRGYCITGELEVGQKFQLAGRCWATNCSLLLENKYFFLLSLFKLVTFSYITEFIHIHHS